MKYNSDTTIEHIPLCAGGYYVNYKGEATALFKDDLTWCVLSFSPNGYCNNASSYQTKKEAWRMFINCIKDDVDYSLCA